MPEVPSSVLQDLASVLSFALSTVHDLETGRTQLDDGSTHGNNDLRIGATAIMRRSKIASFGSPCTSPLAGAVTRLQQATDATEAAQTGQVLLPCAIGEQIDSLSSSLHPMLLGGSVSAEGVTKEYLPNNLRQRWEKLDKQHTKRWSICRAIRFRWIGVYNNRSLKATFMEMYSKLEVLSLRARTLGERLEDLLQDRIKVDMEREIRDGVCDGAQAAVRQESHLLIFQAEDLMRKLEGHLTKTHYGKHGFLVHELFHMASCPVDEFLDAYIQRRDEALELEHMRCGWDADGCFVVSDVAKQISKEKDMVSAAVRGTVQVEYLYQVLQEAIESNDQLVFKMMVLLQSLCLISGKMFLLYLGITGNSVM